MLEDIKLFQRSTAAFLNVFMMNISYILGVRKEPFRQLLKIRLEIGLEVIVYSSQTFDQSAASFTCHSC